MKDNRLVYKRLNRTKKKEKEKRNRRHPCNYQKKEKNEKQGKYTELCKTADNNSNIAGNKNDQTFYIKNAKIKRKNSFKKKKRLLLKLEKSVK